MGGFDISKAKNVARPGQSVQIVTSDGQTLTGRAASSISGTDVLAVRSENGIIHVFSASSPRLRGTKRASVRRRRPRITPEVAFLYPYKSGAIVGLTGTGTERDFQVGGLVPANSTIQIDDFTPGTVGLPIILTFNSLSSDPAFLGYYYAIFIEGTLLEPNNLQYRIYTHSDLTGLTINRGDIISAEQYLGELEPRTIRSHGGTLLEFSPSNRLPTAKSFNTVFGNTVVTGEPPLSALPTDLWFASSRDFGVTSGLLNPTFAVYNQAGDVGGWAPWGSVQFYTYPLGTRNGLNPNYINFTNASYPLSFTATVTYGGVGSSVETITGIVENVFVLPPSFPRTVTDDTNIQQNYSLSANLTNYTIPHETYYWKATPVETPTEITLSLADAKVTSNQIIDCTITATGTYSWVRSQSQDNPSFGLVSAYSLTGTRSYSGTATSDYGFTFQDVLSFLPNDSRLYRTVSLNYDSTASQVITDNESGVGVTQINPTTAVTTYTWNISRTDSHEVTSSYAEQRPSILLYNEFPNGDVVSIVRRIKKSFDIVSEKDLQYTYSRGPEQRQIPPLIGPEFKLDGVYNVESREGFRNYGRHYREIDSYFVIINGTIYEIPVDITMAAVDTFFLREQIGSQPDWDALSADPFVPFTLTVTTPEWNVNGLLKEHRAITRPKSIRASSGAGGTDGVVDTWTSNDPTLTGIPVDIFAFNLIDFGEDTSSLYKYTGTISNIVWGQAVPTPVDDFATKEYRQFNFFNSVEVTEEFDEAYENAGFPARFIASCQLNLTSRSTVGGYLNIGNQQMLVSSANNYNAYLFNELASPALRNRNCWLADGELYISFSKPPSGYNVARQNYQYVEIFRFDVPTLSFKRVTDETVKDRFAVFDHEGTLFDYRLSYYPL